MENSYTSYRWVVLIAAWSVFLTFFAAWYLMPSLEHEILNVYGITTKQYSLIFTSPYLVAGICCVFGGILGDRFGTRIVISVGAFLAAVVTLIRIFLTGFWGVVDSDDVIRGFFSLFTS